MLGASRESLARQSEALDARRQSAGFDTLAGELFSVAGLLEHEHQLRMALADSGQLLAVREGLVREVFTGKVSDLAVAVLVDIVSDRWSNDTDLMLAIEQLADALADCHRNALVRPGLGAEIHRQLTGEEHIDGVVGLPGAQQVSACAELAHLAACQPTGQKPFVHVAEEGNPAVTRQGR